MAVALKILAGLVGVVVVLALLGGGILAFTFLVDDKHNFLPKGLVKPVNRLIGRYGKTIFSGPFCNETWDCKYHYSRRNKRILEQAYDLTYNHLRKALKTSPLKADEQQRILAEAESVPDNIIQLMYKQERVYQLKENLIDSEKAPMENVLQKIDAEIENALKSLGAIPAGLVQLEMAKGDRNFERLVHELHETNDKLLDYAESWQELRDADL